MQVPTEPVLDLDKVDEQQLQREARPHRVSALAATVLFLVGGVIGGGGVHTWQAGQRLADERSAVSVLLFLESESMSKAGSDGDQVSIEGKLTVVNAGPLPVEVRDLRAEVPGMTLLSDSEKEVPPGAAAKVAVQVTVQCASRRHLTYVSVSMSVETADQRSRHVSYPLTIRGSPWYEMVIRSCSDDWPPVPATTIPNGPVVNYRR